MLDAYRVSIPFAEFTAPVYRVLDAVPFVMKNILAGETDIDWHAELQFEVENYMTWRDTTNERCVKTYAVLTQALELIERYNDVIPIAVH